MTLDELRIQLLGYESTASKIYETSEGHMPMVLLLGPDKSFVPCEFDVNLDTRSPEADQSRKMIRVLCVMGALSGAEAVVFISEAWTVHSPPGVDWRAWKAEFDEWRKTHPSLGDHPNRVEILILHGACRDGMILQSFRLKRPGDNGAKVTLIPLAPDYTSVQSRFLGGLTWGPRERWEPFMQLLSRSGRTL